MSDYIRTKTKLKSSFDILPNEILFHIFNYLTSNEIIYSFFYFNERLQNLLLTEKHYFKMPTINLDFWKEILPIIGSQIQTLIINIDYLTVSLDSFSNLTSIIISSPYSLLDEQLKSILNHQYFQQIHTFKIKLAFLSNPSSDVNVLDDEQILFKTIFNNNNNLQIFEYLPSLDGLSYRNLDKLNLNIHIRSLTLNLTDFHDISILIQNTPNLIYLNIQSEMPYKEYSSKNLSKMKLEEFYLKFKSRRIIGYSNSIPTTDFDQLFHFIQLFSSSLITLSLDFTDIYLMDSTNTLFNGVKLENQLLKQMKKLKNFYFYAYIHGCKNIQELSLTFKIFPWPIGFHGNAYLYSLPFPFYELKHFHDFQYVLLNNDEILKDNYQLWSKVKSLELIRTDRIDFKNLFPLIKQNMPKLSSITFHGKNHYNLFKPYYPYIFDDSYDEIECINVQLNSVTTVRLDVMPMKQIEQILIHSFPNLQCLILNYTAFSSKDIQLTSFLGQKIQRIESDEFSLQENPREEKDISYFSNLKHLKLTCGLTHNDEVINNRSRIINNFLTKLPILETLSIYAIPCSGCVVYGPQNIFHPIMNGLDENQIKIQYKIKYSGQYMWFIKNTVSSPI